MLSSVNGKAAETLKAELGSSYNFPYGKTEMLFKQFPVYWILEVFYDRTVFRLGQEVSVERKAHTLISTDIINQGFCYGALANSGWSVQADYFLFHKRIVAKSSSGRCGRMLEPICRNKKNLSLILRFYWAIKTNGSF